MWRAIIDEQSVPVAAFGAVGQAFWRPGQGSVLAPYPTRFLDALPEIGQRGMIFGLSAAGSLFPLTGSTRTTLTSSTIGFAPGRSHRSLPTAGSSGRTKSA